ncbi:hypothetical protein SPI_03729 [Niveomyces insectorum RCEF 264]|uniref:Uncharacterized protein n=1 Tax=Niveomyces insectorum RCEF 264 TaxID=1081102 RepID=A0A167WB47_9HYPO|nr:hypothetical protein SPI_03729 [Niveomyces insectorum RCEF 264]
MSAATATQSQEGNAASVADISVPGFENVVWTQSTTKEGRSFAVGVGQPTADNTSDAAVVDAKGGPVGSHGDPEAFEMDVHWPVDGTEHITTSEVYDLAGLQAYKVEEQPWYAPWFKYCLRIRNNVNYLYTFTDESNDTYDLRTVINGWHFLLYNSDQPTIVHVQGTP